MVIFYCIYYFQVKCPTSERHFYARQDFSSCYYCTLFCFTLPKAVITVICNFSIIIFLMFGALKIIMHDTVAHSHCGVLLIYINGISGYNIIHKIYSNKFRSLDKIEKGKNNIWSRQKVKIKETE